MSLEAALLGRARGAWIARVGDLALAERRLDRSAAARLGQAKLSRRLVAREKRSSVRLRVIATDAGRWSPDGRQEHLCRGGPLGS